MSKGFLFGGTEEQEGLPWETVADIDWETEANHDFTAVPGYTDTNGLDWTAENMGNANQFEIINGTGLVADPLLSADQPVFTAPHIRCTVGDLRPAGAPAVDDEDWWSFMHYVTSTTVAGVDFNGNGMIYKNAAGTSYVAGFNYFAAAANANINLTNVDTGVNRGSNNTVPGVPALQTLIEFQVRGNSVFPSYAPWAGTFPDPWDRVNPGTWIRYDGCARDDFPPGGAGLFLPTTDRYGIAVVRGPAHPGVHTFHRTLIRYRRQVTPFGT